MKLNISLVSLPFFEYIPAPLEEPPFDKRRNVSSGRFVYGPIEQIQIKKANEKPDFLLITDNAPYK